MTGDRAKRALAGTRFADLSWIPETGSTNADVLEKARAGDHEGVVLVADHQTAGRGRAGRTWEAPAGSSILMSVLLRPPMAVAGLSTAALAVSAAGAVEAVAGFSPGVKWPNDLVVESDDGSMRKLAGVLAEADWPAGSDISSGWRQPSPSERVAVVAGIGINVNWPDEIPEALRDIAISISHVTGRETDREELVVATLQRLDQWRGDMEAGGEQLLAEWRRRLVTLGRRIRIDLGGDDAEGTAVDVTREGHLVLDTLEGERETFSAGDVTHFRRVG